MHPASSPVRQISPYRSRNTRKRLRTLLFAVGAALSLMVLMLRSVQARQTPRELVAKGDRSWGEKSYADAAEAYTPKRWQQILSCQERPEMQLRILIADIKASKWDDAIALSDAYQKEHRGTLYEGLGLQWRARLYVSVDHSSYRVGNRIFRGSDVPASRGEEAPEQVNLDSEDALEAQRSFEQCRLLLDRSRKASLPAELRARAAAVEAEDDFDLIARIGNNDDSDKFRPDRTDWSIDFHQLYDLHWPIARQVMYLYHEIVALDSETPGSSHHNTVLANLGKAAFIVKLRSQSSWVVRRGRQQSEQIHVFIPYVKEDPIALLEETVHKYPEDPEADRLAFTAALWRDQSGDSGHAAAAYITLLAAYPHGRWTSDAKKNLDVLVRPALAVSASAFTRPGTRLSLELTTRNISIVKFTAYRIHPETRFAHTSYKDEYERHPPFTDIIHHFLSPAEKERYAHEKIAEWTATTSNNGLHNQATDSVNTPLDSLGAYIIEARAADHSEIGADTLAIVTDIAIVQKVDRDSVLCYVADSKTGKPVSGAKLSIWEPRRQEQIERDAVYASGVTDSGGAFRAALPAQLDAPPGGFTVNRTAETFAWVGGNRYAVAAAANYNTSELPIGEAGYRGYITSDRPLYRPAQTISYRLILTNGSPQKYTLAANKEILITLEGPKGEVQHIAAHTNSTGAVNDTFMLPASAELGDYRLIAKPPAALKLPDSVLYAVHDFRVEEYKKPEFAVTVTPEKSEVRVGEKMTVTVSAAYFFGAPVTYAKVHYKVYRKPFIHLSPFKPRVAWFPGEPEPRNRFGRSGEEFDSNYWSAPGSVYREGDLISDAKGEAKLTFPTDPPKPPKGYATNPGLDTDQGFTIEATVVDDSRREVSGSGTAVAGALRFHAALRLDRAFVLPGDALQIEVNTRDSGDRPTAADGAITLWKQIPAIKERKVRDDDTGKMVVVQPFVPARQEKDGMLLARTDVEHSGNFTAFWHPTTAAEYILEYEAADGWEHTVDVKQAVLVYGTNFDDRLEKDDNRWGIGAEHEIYQQGDMARLLLVTPEPNCYVLLTEAAQGAIRHFRTVFVPGRSTIVEIPIGREHLPNAALSASLIVNGQVLEASVEVNVAAVNQMLSLSVTTDKKEYKPGEHAVFHLHAVGADGKPAVGEINLGVVDEALLAMQPDETPDIRTSFYGFRIATTVSGANSSEYEPEQKLLAPPMRRSMKCINWSFPEGMSWVLDQSSNSSQQLPEYVVLEPEKSVETDPAQANLKYRNSRFALATSSTI